MALSGIRAIVTGGASGLGLASATRLAKAGGACDAIRCVTCAAWHGRSIGHPIGQCWMEVWVHHGAKAGRCSASTHTPHALATDEPVAQRRAGTAQADMLTPHTS
jgi:NAD(P)-dependent dehydrogenase (short-subunit alcohol dehydrogenase family)